MSIFYGLVHFFLLSIFYGLVHIRTTVLLIFVATSINFLAYAIYKEFIIIANVFPAAVCIFIHSHYQRKITKMDRLED